MLVHSSSAVFGGCSRSFFFSTAFGVSRMILVQQSDVMSLGQLGEEVKGAGDSMLDGLQTGRHSGSLHRVFLIHVTGSFLGAVVLQ